MRSCRFVCRLVCRFAIGGSGGGIQRESENHTQSLQPFARVSDPMTTKTNKTTTEAGIDCGARSLHRLVEKSRHRRRERPKIVRILEARQSRRALSPFLCGSSKFG